MKLGEARRSLTAGTTKVTRVKEGPPASTGCVIRAWRTLKTDPLMDPLQRGALSGAMRKLNLSGFEQPRESTLFGSWRERVQCPLSANQCGMRG